MTGSYSIIRSLVFPRIMLAVICLAVSSQIISAKELANDDLVAFSVTQGTNFSLALSPDGQYLVIDLQGRLWTLPSSGGKATPITPVMNESRNPAWSGDGEWLIFQHYIDNWDIWKINKDGSQAQQLTSGLSDDREPQWSPDGERVIFSSDRNGNYDLWQLEIGSGELTQITDNPVEEYQPGYSPDGMQIAYVSEQENRINSLLVRNRTGDIKEIFSSKKKLAYPKWSPDGKKIGFHEFESKRGTGDLYVKDLISGNAKKITIEEEDVFPKKFSWLSNEEILYSADGRMQKRFIAGQARQTVPFSAQFTIAKRNQYSKRSHKLKSTEPENVLGILRPVVSPDGKQIAFTALSELWMLNVGKSTPQRLTNDQYLDVDPAWSPDGKQLAYLSDRRGSGSMDLYIRNMFTGEERRITGTENDLRQPRWSPDGNQIAIFMRDANDWHTANLHVIDVQSGDMRLVYKGLFLPSAPSWTKDGTSIMTMALKATSKRYRKGFNAFFIISLDTGEGKFITPYPNRSLSTRSQFGPLLSPDGQSLAYLDNGMLWVSAITKKGELTGVPRQLTLEYTSYPSWTGDSKSIVYLAIDKLKRVELDKGKISEIPFNLKWKRNVPLQRTIVQAGNVFNGISPDYLEDVDIIIDGNVITDIVPRRKNWRNAKVVDARTSSVVPGLFQMHIHHFVTDGEKPGRIWLSFGITAVREPGAEPYEALERKESWESGSRIGPRQFYSAILEGERLYYWMNIAVDNVSYLDMEMQRALKLDYDFIKLYERVPDAMQKRVIDFAHRHGLTVTSHEIYPAATFGIDVVEHMITRDRMEISDRMSNELKIYDDVVNIMKHADIHIVPTAAGRAPSAAFIYQFDKNPGVVQLPQVKAFTPKYLGASDYLMNYQHRFYGEHAARLAVNEQKAIRRLTDSNILIGAGTDGGTVSYGYSLIMELKYFADSGMGNFRALQTATINAAKATGVDAYLGSLEAGKLADMVIVDGDPLNNILDLYNVEIVLRGGVEHSIEDLLQIPDN